MDKKLSIEEIAKKYWTADRLKKLCHDKKFILTPLNAAELLLALEILNKDASLSHDAVRKLIQVNHLALQVSQLLGDLNSRIGLPVILDLGCGKGYLTFLLAWLYQFEFKKPVKIIGVDSEPKRIEKIKKISAALNLSSVEFVQSTIEAFQATERVHAVFALHACDVASDHALGFCIAHHVDLFAVAPCCQLELSRHWKKMAEDKVDHPLSPAFNSPQLRKDIAAEFTDALRMEGMRACGYEVTVSEFVSPEHTPKNRLLTGIRRGLYDNGSLEKFGNLKAYLGSPQITLEKYMVDNSQIKDEAI